MIRILNILNCKVIVYVQGRYQRIIHFHTMMLKVNCF